MINYANYTNTELIILGENDQCCWSQSILSPQPENELQIIELPGLTDLALIERVVIKQLSGLCVPRSDYLICPKNISYCIPIQDIKIFQMNIKQYAKLGMFVLNGKYYGTNHFSIYEIYMEDFVTDNQLKLHIGNDLFSYLFYKNKTLFTFNNLPENVDILCNTTHEQLLMYQNFNKVSNKLFGLSSFFTNLYEINKNQTKRVKRANYFSEIFGEMLSTDKTDLQNIHNHINDFVQYSNKELIIEKHILAKLTDNDKKIFSKINTIQIQSWYSKLVIFQFQLEFNRNIQYTTFVSSMIGLNQNFENLKGLLQTLWSSQSNETYCFTGFGCFNALKSHVLYENRIARIELYKIVMKPYITYVQTCNFANETHVFTEKSCHLKRKLEKSEFFIKQEDFVLLLLFQNNTLSVTCNKNKTIFINKMQYVCLKSPTQFYTEINSLKLTKTSREYIVKNIHAGNLRVDMFNENFIPNFTGHLTLHNLDSLKNLSLFEEILPEVVISPTSLGICLSLMTGLLFILLVCSILYAVNYYFKGIVSMCACCCADVCTKRIDSTDQTHGIERRKSVSSLHAIEQNVSISSSQESLSMIVKMSSILSKK